MEARLVVGGMRKAPSQATEPNHCGLALFGEKNSKFGQVSPCVLSSGLLPTGVTPLNKPQPRATGAQRGLEAGGGTWGSGQDLGQVHPSQAQRCR